MEAYQGTLTYDTSVLTATAADAEYSGGICQAGCEDNSPETINDGTGEVTWEVTLTGFPTGYSGSGGMVKITFRVDAAGTSALTPLTFLLDPGLNEIVHTDFSGTFDTTLRPTADFRWDANQDGTFENGTSITGESVNFDGSISSNPLGGALTYSWDVFNDGIVDGSGVTLKFTFTNPGGSVVRLTVCATGNVCSSKAKVIPVIPKVAPTAIISPTSLTVNFTQPAAFDGSRSYDNNDPPQAITRYIFTVNGTIAQNSTSAFFSYTAPGPGNYTIGVRACNQSNLCSGFSNAQLRVRAIIGVPTAVLKASDAKISLGDTVNFDGSQTFDNSNPPLPISRYIFSVNDTLEQNSTSPAFALTPAAEGSYNVSLVSCNQAGVCSNNPAFSVVTVNPAGKERPTGVLSPTGSVKVDFKTKIQFNATDSFDNNTPPQSIVRFIFRVNGTESQNGPSALFSFNATAPGTYVISLRVCNESSLCSLNPANATATVNAIKAVPTATITPAIVKVGYGDYVVFNGTQSHDNSNPIQALVNYTFTVNGTRAQSGISPILNFTAPSPGSYTIGLVVCSESGLCGQVTAQLTVNIVKAAPTARISASDAKVLVGQTVVFDGSQSFDNSRPLQTIVRYVFNVNSVESQNGTSPTFSFTSNTPGTFTISLAVCNESDLCSTPASVQAVVNPETHNLQVFSVTPNATSVARGSTVEVAIIVKNIGNLEETFQLHVRVANSTQTVPIQTLSATLGPGSQESYNVEWRTDTFLGMYQVEAEAELAADIDPADNTGSGGNVFISVRDLEILQVSASPSTVPRGDSVTITVEVKNRGNLNETFQLIVTAGTITIDDSTKSLNAGLTQTFTIVWQTSTVGRGSYPILARAVLASDMDQSDNQRSGGNVVVQVHDVSLLDAVVSQTTVSPGDSVTIGVIVENSGDFAETVTVTVAVEGQISLTAQSATLQPGEQKTLNFTWATTGVSAGTYGYEADLQNVSGDISTSDNVILAPDAVEVLSPPSPAPFIDYGLLAILLILLGLLSVVLLIRVRGRRSRPRPGS